MNNAAQDQTVASDRVNSRKGPGPSLLPGIEGFYILTAAGTLGRYEPDGGFVEEPALSERLGDATAALLHRYRNDGPGGIALGLVTRKNPERPWRCASLVFSDTALREIYRTSEDPNDSGGPLTAFQQRNKTKSVYRGMELMLDTRKASQPEYPRFCPVLFAPESGEEALGRHYGVDDLETVNALEVLDLMAPLTPQEQRQPALSRMVVEMARAGITPELRHAPELKLVDSGQADEDDAPEALRTADDRPWEDETEERFVSFNDGDPITYWVLSWFTPFSELNDLQRQFVARGHTVTKKPAGSTLIQRGSTDDSTLYLIEGTLELEAFDGRQMTITGGTRRAQLPVSQLRPHAYTVKAATGVTVMYVSQDMIREINRITTTYRSRPGIEVTEDEPSFEPGAGGITYEPGFDRS